MNNAVSVVVPTIGRPELERALISVRGQDYHGEVQIILAVDGTEAKVGIPQSVRQLADAVRWTGGAKRGSFARNLGVDAADGRWVAFLDDDDEWLPEKLAMQVEVATAAADDGASPVVATRHVQVDSATGRQSLAIPKFRYEVGRVDDYLFHRRRPGGGRASIYTSTLLCQRDLARDVRWDESLVRHQDWDWLIRATSVPGVELRQLVDPLVRVYTGSKGSISASANWKDSLRWADETLGSYSSVNTYVDFLVAQTLRYAVAARSSDGIREVVRRLRKAEARPSVGPILIAGGGVIPRHMIERLMTWIR